MFQRFISLQWKSFFRSSSVGKSIALKIFMALMALYFGVIFLLLGIGLYPLLLEYYPEQEPIIVVNRLVLIWFVLELVMRFMLQTLPVMSVKPLLILPIKKRRVIDYVLLRSFFSFFNFLPLLIIIPFAIFNLVKTDIAFPALLGWGITIYSLDLCVNLANFLVKKKFLENLKAIIPFAVVVIALAALDYYKVWEITVYFGQVLNYVLIYPITACIPVFLLIILYLWNRRVLERRFYLDGSLKGKTTAVNTRDFSWTKRFGDIAPFLQLDLKLIWRNKRPKTTIFLSLIIMGYGLIFYPQDIYADMPAIFVFVGIFMTGIFMINFGQFIPAWDASYYPMMMSQNIPLKKYLASKAGLITFSVIILTILTTPYVYFGWNILLLNIACAIYNIGVNVPVLLYVGSFNRKRIDLEKSPFMNYQGTGAAQWIVGLPLMLIPILLFWIFNKFISFDFAVGVLVGFGVLGALFRSQLMNQIEAAYRKNKYAMINGFKQTGD